MMVRSIRETPQEEWDSLTDGNPFSSHWYLSSLEETNCVGDNTGWTPCHILCSTKTQLVAAMPLYLKTHSYGEYVFDWAWADAYHRNGLNYYPKLVSAIPFTPVTGPRLLGNTSDSHELLLDIVLNFAKKNKLSSFHCLFPNYDNQLKLESRSLLARKTVQFHWENKNFLNFESFLSSMNHKNRKKIKQERRRLSDNGFSFRRLPGDQCTKEDWEFFYKCYVNTYSQHHSSPYLNLNFFLTLARKSPHNLLLVLAEKEGERVASALNIRGENALYGRYWGTTRFVSGLHFEVCYYQALEHCIKNRIGRFEGGAQGEHKLSRGLEPVTTYSAHWLAHPQFRAAITEYLEKESQGVSSYVNELNDHSPFKNKPLSLL